MAQHQWALQNFFAKDQILLHSQSKKEKKVIKLMMERRNVQYIRKMHIFIS